MQQPQRDAFGVVPHDHLEILVEDRLVRYLVVGANVHPDGKGSWRISSGAFSRSTPRNDPRSYASVDLEKLLLVDGQSPSYRLPSPKHGAAVIKVGQVRQLNLLVGWIPLTENIAHCGIWGELQKKSIANKLAKEAVLVIDPTP
jgi:hypothetical protein